ncbi:hypothetical protein BGW38_007161 [Lunasporangiospora selenospora]|uniref:Uncharacterized protein n=1 Tax=Lunasporangiospora selenospora TaxID=979761 RepID=A0A9P6G0P5_9FUNG|nr:hypothetical protein BGW38_007161 [Lunasporangiospora selenospora]
MNGPCHIPEGEVLNILLDYRFPKRGYSLSPNQTITSNQVKVLSVNEEPKVAPGPNRPRIRELTFQGVIDAVDYFDEILYNMCWLTYLDLHCWEYQRTVKTNDIALDLILQRLPSLAWLTVNGCSFSSLQDPRSFLGNEIYMSPISKLLDRRRKSEAPRFQNMLTSDSDQASIRSNFKLKHFGFQYDIAESQINRFLKVFSRLTCLESIQVREYCFLPYAGAAMGRFDRDHPPSLGLPGLRRESPEHIWAWISECCSDIRIVSILGPAPFLCFHLQSLTGLSSIASIESQETDDLEEDIIQQIVRLVELNQPGPSGPLPRFFQLFPNLTTLRLGPHAIFSGLDLVLLGIYSKTLVHVEITWSKMTTERRMDHIWKERQSQREWQHRQAMTSKDVARFLREAKLLQGFKCQSRLDARDFLQVPALPSVSLLPFSTSEDAHNESSSTAGADQTQPELNPMNQERQHILNNSSTEPVQTPLYECVIHPWNCETTLTRLSINILVESTDRQIHLALYQLIGRLRQLILLDFLSSTLLPTLDYGIDQIGTLQKLQVLRTSVACPCPDIQAILFLGTRLKSLKRIRLWLNEALGMQEYITDWLKREHERQQREIERPQVNGESNKESKEEEIDYLGILSILAMDNAKPKVDTKTGSPKRGLK